eukprot:14132232-Ditylum_brightwellii.AAC.1
MYGFEVTSLDEKQGDKLISVLDPKLLPRMGYQRMFPKAIVFVTAKYSGIGLYHPMAEEAVATIAFVLKHLRADNSVGQVLAILLRWAQILAGVSTYILQDTRLIPHMEGKWVENLRGCIHKVGATTHHNTEWKILPMQEHYMHIMS